MAFWNRKNKNQERSVDMRDRAITELRININTLRNDMAILHTEVADLRKTPVPTNSQPRAGSVQDALPIMDRMQELLLVQMGNADLAQAFGLATRQKELRAAEPEPETDWVEPTESSYENL